MMRRTITHKHCLLLLLVLLLALPLTAQDAVDEPFNLSETDGMSDNARLIVDDADNLHVIWTEDALRDIGSGLAHRLRTPDGTWTETVDLTEPFSLWTPGSGDFAIRADGTVCVVLTARVRSIEFLAPWERCFVDEVWSEATRYTNGIGFNVQKPQVVYGADDTRYHIFVRDNDIILGGADQELSDEVSARNPNLT